MENKKQIAKAYYSSFSVLFDSNEYPQNVCLNQVKFPAEFWGEDVVVDAYDDRIRGWIGSDAVAHIKPCPCGTFLEGSIEKMTPEQLLDWGNQIFKAIYKNGDINGYEKLTGFRVVRFTNVQSGYPVYRYDGFLTKEPENRELFTGLQGANLEHRPRKDKKNSSSGDYIVM